MPTSKHVIWDGTERLVLFDPNFIEPFILDQATITSGRVTLNNVVTSPEKVRVFIKGFTELQGADITSRPNFRIDGSDLVFDEPGLYGITPPVGALMDVFYHSANLEDVLKENPEIQISSSYDTTTQTLKLAIWMHENGQTISPVDCAVDVADFGTSVINQIGLSPDVDGVCYLTNVGTALTLNGTYTVKVTMNTPGKIYTQIIKLDVAGTNTDDIVSAMLLACAEDGLPDRIFVYDSANPTKPQRIIEMHSNGIVKRRDFVYNIDNVPVTETVTPGP